MLNLNNLINNLSVSNIRKSVISSIIACIPTFEESIHYLTGVLSNGNKTSQMSGAIDEYGNVWGQVVSPSDTNKYALETAITAAGLGAGDEPLLGLVDTVTGQFAGFRFINGFSTLVDFGGAVLESNPGIGTPQAIGFTYQASTNTIEFYFKVLGDGGKNPDKLFTINTITATPNPVRFVVGVDNQSGIADFTFTTNDGPSEFEIVYENGVTTACGTPFCDLDFMNLTIAGEPFLLSNGNRTLSTDTNSVGTGYAATLNQDSLAADTEYRLMEITIDSIVDPANTVIQFGLLDGIAINAGVVAFIPGQGLIFASNNGIEVVEPTYIPNVGETIGISINRSTGQIYGYYSDINGIIQTRTSVGFADNTTDLNAILFVEPPVQASQVVLTHTCNAAESIGIYGEGVKDFCDIDGKCQNQFTDYPNGGAANYFQKDVSGLISTAINNIGLSNNVIDVGTGFVLETDTNLRVIEYEITNLSAYLNATIGFTDSNTSIIDNYYYAQFLGNGDVNLVQNDGGSIVSVNVATGVTLTTGDIIGLGLNVDTGLLYLTINGVDYSNTFVPTAGVDFKSYVLFGLDNTETVTLTARNGIDIQPIYPTGATDTCGYDVSGGGPIGCLNTYQATPFYTSGTLSNFNKTTTFEAVVGDFGNVWGESIAATDSKKYAFEFLPGAGIGGIAGDFVRIGFLNETTGQFAGFSFDFDTNIASLIDWDGTTLDTTLLLFANSIGFTYQASTNEIVFYFKYDEQNPESFFTVKNISSVNDNVQAFVGATNLSGGLFFPLTINDGPSEFEIVYEDGVTTACGNAFCDLGLLSDDTYGEPFNISDNKRLYTTNTGSVGPQYIGLLNTELPLNDNNFRISEIEIESTTTPADITSILIGQLDFPLLNSPGLLALEATGLNFLYAVGGVITTDTLIPLYVPVAGDIIGIATNRTTGESYIYANTSVNGEETWMRNGVVDTTNSMIIPVYIDVQNTVNETGIRLNYNAADVQGVYVAGAVDYCGNPAGSPIGCLDTFESDSTLTYTTGALSNGDKTTKIAGPAGDYGNVWGAVVNTADPKIYALEQKIDAFAFDGGQDKPILGIIDNVTGDFAGFKFDLGIPTLFDFNGSVLDTGFAGGPPIAIGMTYQASTDTLKFYFKSDAKNPDELFTVTTTSATANDVRFIVGANNNSGIFDFDYTINDGPAEFEIVYESGVTTACGNAFCETDLTSYAAVGEPILLSNNKKTLTTDTASVGTSYAGISNGFVPAASTDTIVMEYVVDSVVDPANSVIQFGLSDGTTTLGAVGFIGAGGLIFASDNGSTILDGAYTVAPGDVLGVAVNRSTGACGIYLNDGGVETTWSDVGLIETLTDLPLLLALGVPTQASGMTITHHLNAADMVGTYPVGAVDLCGNTV